MKRGEKIAKLIDALDDGYIIYSETTFGEREFLFKTENDQYERKGWGSALGTSERRMYDLIQNPDEWKIFEGFNMFIDEYPYPWSIKWEENDGK